MCVWGGGSHNIICWGSGCGGGGGGGGVVTNGGRWISGRRTHFPLNMIGGHYQN